MSKPTRIRKRKTPDELNRENELNQSRFDAEKKELEDIVAELMEKNRDLEDQLKEEHCARECEDQLITQLKKKVKRLQDMNAAQWRHNTGFLPKGVPW